MSNLLEVHDLTKTYKKGLLRKGFPALRQVSLAVGPGTVFGLLGPNGAGKTTLIKILLGLVRPTSGEAQLFGHPVGDPAGRKRVGYLPEAHRLPNYLTGRKLLRLFGMLAGHSKSEVEKRIPALLEAVDMRAHADRKIREYSKGMQQRLGLAQALIHNPELIFLDEPTDGVDPIGRAAIRQVVSRLRDQGVTLFINSHLLLEVELMCDHVVIMDKGAIIREGTIEELTPRTGSVSFELTTQPESMAEDPIASMTARLQQVLGELGSGLKANRNGFDLLATQVEQDQCIDRLRAAKIGIRAISQKRLNLEESFIDLVKKERA